MYAKRNLTDQKWSTSPSLQLLKNGGLKGRLCNKENKKNVIIYIKEKLLLHVICIIVQAGAFVIIVTFIYLSDDRILATAYIVNVSWKLVKMIQFN